MSTEVIYEQHAGSVEPGTISVLCRDSADSEYNSLGLKFSCLYECASRCYKRASTEGGRGHLIKSLTIVKLHYAPQVDRTR